MKKEILLLVFALIFVGTGCKKEQNEPTLTYPGTWDALFSYYHQGQADAPIIWSSVLTINADGTAQAKHESGNPIAEGTVEEHYNWAKVDEKSMYLRSKNWSVTNNTMIYEVKEYSNEQIILEGFDDHSQFWRLILRKPSDKPAPTYPDCNAVNYFNTNNYEFAQIDTNSSFRPKINNKREIIGIRFADESSSWGFTIINANLQKIRPSLPTPSFSHAYEYYIPKSINNKSEIVGEHSANGVYYRSFLYKSGLTTGIQYPNSNLRVTNAALINDDGLIVGTHDESEGFHRNLFFFKNNQYTSKKFPVNDVNYVELTDINNNQIFGYYRKGQNMQAFTMDFNGNLTDLTFPAAISNQLSIFGLNNLGQKVGTFSAEVTCNNSPYKKWVQHGILINANGDHKIIDIPDAISTILWDINENGDIIGSATKIVKNKTQSFTFILKAKK